MYLAGKITKFLILLMNLHWGWPVTYVIRAWCNCGLDSIIFLWSWCISHNSISFVDNYVSCISVVFVSAGMFLWSMAVWSYMEQCDWQHQFSGPLLKMEMLLLLHEVKWLSEHDLIMSWYRNIFISIWISVPFMKCQPWWFTSLLMTGKITNADAR
jgi:hypothetical protein